MAGEMGSDMTFTFTVTSAAENTPTPIAAAIDASFSVSSEMGIGQNRGFVGVVSSGSGRSESGSVGSGSRGSTSDAGMVTA